MAQAINKMKKQELVMYIVDATHGTEHEKAPSDLTVMLKKDLAKLAEQIFADSLQEEPSEELVEHKEEQGEESKPDAKNAEYFHMHFKSNAKLDFECAVTFRKLDDDKWICHKSSKKNLAWMTKPKVIYASGKYEPGVQREVISVYERDIKVLKHWLTSGRHGKTVSMYFSNNELPDYDACEVGKPMYQSEALIDVKPGEEIPF